MAIRWVNWSLLAGILAGGWFFVEESARREWRLMQEMVAGYAPTFAAEMQRLRHEEVTLKTSPDDPHYWQLIQAQKRWLAANPVIGNVFTVRKLPDGRAAVLVDAETDYNRDGTLSGEIEQRTPVGTIHQDVSASQLESVYAGEPVFRGEPYSDRRGTWVTALVPLRNFKGNVEAALGVDFDARAWMATVDRLRRSTLWWVAVMLAIIAGAGTVVGRQIPAREAAAPAIRRRPANAEAPPAAVAEAAPVTVAEPSPVVVIEAAPSVPETPVAETVSARAAASAADEKATNVEKQKLETLVNSIDGIVWEAEAATSRFTFVSRQCERLLGYAPEDWLANPNFWAEKLHPDDQWAREHWSKMVNATEPYSHEYRMIAADGRTVWIRENAAVLLDETGTPLFVRGVLYDITARKKAAEELEAANAALVDSSRFAGMAEVATGVLHNVGNVLNSVNVSGDVISERLRRSKTIELGKVAGLLTLHASDFAGFVARDPRGPHVPELISCIADALKAEHAELLEEVESITRNIGHIKEIVAMQQGFAKGEGIVEALTIQSLVDDAIKINSVSLARHRIAVVQAYEEVPQVLVDKHLVLQILVNLLRNAKQAIQESGIEPRRIVVRIQNSAADMVKVSVQDSGTGIPPENLTRIFSHGFTTKKNGHGFGLHSSALAATGMGGSLHAQSEGSGKGATFILELPVYREMPVAAAA